MEAAVGARCEGSTARFSLADPEHRLLRVRLVCGIFGSPDLVHDATVGAWQARLPLPDVARIEYRFELIHHDGRHETIRDPTNTRHAPGGYGDSSVLWCPGYREPPWLDQPVVDGTWRDVHLPLPALCAESSARIFSPTEPTGRVLIAHDGIDYHQYGQLGQYAGATIASGQVRPYHLVLLSARERFDWYAASPAYAQALAFDVLPKLAAELGADRPVIGVGASLGALALLHAQRRYPAGFGGLFLQSGSFFQPRFDRQEADFAWWPRIVRFTGQALRAAMGPGVPMAMTCGTVEENLSNNRDMAQALLSQGYDLSLTENRDAHNWVGWRDTFDPHLTALLQRVWP